MGTSGGHDSLVIALKPGYASSLGNAARQFRAFWVSLLVVSAVLFVVEYLGAIPGYLPQANAPSVSLWYVVYMLVFVLLAVVFGYGYAFATLKAARGEKPSARDLVRPFSQFSAVVLSAILLVLIVGLGFVLLIVPGIFFLCRLAFVPYLVVDQRAGVGGAIKGSWQMTRGHFWRIFLLGLTYFGVALALFAVFAVVLSATGNIDLLLDNSPMMLVYELVLNVVYLPISLYMMLTMGSLYHAIRLERDGARQANVEGIVPAGTGAEGAAGA